MREIFSFDRIANPPMELAPIPGKHPDELLVQSGDLLFARQSLKLEGAGKCVLVLPADVPRTFESHLIRVRLTPTRADPTFYYYYFGSSIGRENMSTIVEQVAAAGIRASDLGRLVVPVPPIEVQRSIAATLRPLDDKIESNRRVVSLLEKRLQAEFQHLKQNAPVRRVPLGEMVDLTKGISYRSADLQPSRTSMVTLKSLDRRGGYKPDGLKPYVGRYKPQQVIAPGEVVVAQTDLTQDAEVVGRAARVPASDSADTLVASLDLVIVRPREVSREYLLGVLADDEFRQHCRARTSGTTVLHLAADAIPGYDAPVLPTEIQQGYSHLARDVLGLADCRNRESEQLVLLRNALLPELLSGRIRVPEAEEAAAGVGA